MLKPNRHTNPDNTIINVSAYILKRLRRTRVKSVDELRTLVVEKDSRNDPIFLPSLQFLFLLGVIEYHPKNDKIEYLKSDEA